MTKTIDQYSEFDLTPELDSGSNVLRLKSDVADIKTGISIQPNANGVIGLSLYNSDDATNYGWSNISVLPETPDTLLISSRAVGTGVKPVKLKTTIPLILSGAPTVDLGAATKKYVDDITSAIIAGGGYVLPQATASVLGGVKQGSRITITDGVISANVTKSDVGLSLVDNLQQEPLISKSVGYAKWGGSSWSFANESYILSSEKGSNGGVATLGGTGKLTLTQLPALTDILPNNEVSGYVLKTYGDGSYSWAAETGSGTNYGTRINTTRTFYTATAGQTVLGTLPTFTVGASQARVFVNGVRLYPEDYVETNATTITLNTGCALNDSIMVEIDGYTNYGVTASDVTFSATGGIEAINVQNALVELDTEKAPKAAPTLTGVVSLTDTTDSSSASTGAMTISGGIGVAKNIFAGTSIRSLGGDFRSIKAGSDSASVGPFYGLMNADASRQWLFQLSAANNYDLWYYNGSTWVKKSTLDTSGNLSVTGTITESSSIRLKENVRQLDSSLEKVLKLTGVIYDRKDNGNKNEPGLIAEDVYDVIPELVSKDDSGKIVGIKYTKIIAYLVEAIKELSEEVKSKNG
jgi:hypothetical protein